MDDKILIFNQKLNELLAYAKKKNNILEQQEVISFFSDVEFDADKTDSIYEFLEKSGIEIVYPVTEQDDVDLDLDLSLDDDNVSDDDMDIDLDKIDLSVPEGVATDDPVRMYLKEIGKVPLLSAAEEQELAERIANGDEEAKKKLAEANLRLVVSIAKR